MFLFFLAACGHKDLRTTFSDYHFDQQVISKLPIYDSLVTELIQHYPTTAQFNYGKSGYRYVPSQQGNDLYKVFPAEVGDKIKHHLSSIGNDFIYGFDCYKDTTIRIMIRDVYIQKDHVNISERLSYYPPGMNITRREFPIKDTILNNHWQYWISFSKDFF
jgi:hypothetical protein